MRLTTLALAAMAVAAPLGAANAQSAPPSSYDQGFQRHMNHVLSHEQRAMLHEEFRAQGMDKEQREQAYHQQMQKMAAMNPQQRDQVRNDLQARWNALPAAQKQQLEQWIAERHQWRQENRQRNQPNGQQQGPQQYAPQQNGPQGSAQQDDDDE